MKKIYTLIFVLMLTGLSLAQSTPNNTAYTTYNTEANNELVFIKLRASTTNDSYSTEVYFNPLASLGFDFGFDAAIFGITPDFAIYTDLVEDSIGDNIALQAVNTNDLASVSIPLGVNAYQGEQLTISIDELSLPSSVEVYLDDTLENTSTLLNNSDFIITPTNDLLGVSRFFLRTSIPPTVYTYNGSWSPTDPNGVALFVDNLIITSGNATIIADTACNTLTVNPGASITVNSGTTLTVTNGLTLESSSTSYSSLIRNGSISGQLNYQRHVNINGSGTTGSNDLISAPLTGQPFNEFALANPNILSNNDDTLFLFGPFEKTNGSFVTYTNTETATLDPGVGYRAGSDDNGTFTFTGSDSNGNVSHNILNQGSNNPEWNLVGNPYPSYLSVQDFLLHDVGGLINIQLFDAPTAAIYGYDGTAQNGWTVYNLANTTASTVIAPGQGFFVSADPTNIPLYDLEFTPAMRSTGTTDDFIVGREAAGTLIYFKLNASTASDGYDTEVYFNPLATLGFNFGFDAELFNNPAFVLYTELVEWVSGNPTQIALQTINTDDLADTTIPLGLRVGQGEQVTFSLTENTLPATTEVFLDDTEENIITPLHTIDYVFTPATAIDGTGRFFIRVFDETLSTTENSFNYISISAINKSKEIVVRGQLKEDTTLTLFDIQGRQVLSTQLDSSTIANRVDTSNLSAGVYVVNLNSNQQNKSQKLVIN